MKNNLLAHIRALVASIYIHAISFLETCGDLDVLITHPNGIEFQTDLIEKIIAKLHNENFLTHDLTLQKDGSQKKYLGVCKLIENDRSKHRRLDIILVPGTE